MAEIEEKAEEKGKIPDWAVAHRDTPPKIKRLKKEPIEKVLEPPQPPKPPADDETNYWGAA